jgi:hypothetical protein
MSFPVYETVSQNVVTVLQGLLADPPASGYSTTLSAIERWKIKPPNTPADLKAIVYAGIDARPEGDDKTPIQDTAWRRSYEIFVYVADDEASDIPYEQRINVVRADVEKILLAEIKNETFFQKTVQNLWATGAAITTDAGGEPGVSIFLEIDIRTDQFDPYLQG